MRFVLNDESKPNSHGFILSNSGGDFSRFAENPVALFQHKADHVIGKWERLLVEGSLLVAELEYDEGDQLAMECRRKVEKGYLKGCSPGIIVRECEWRSVEEKGYLVVTKWELCEASLVSVPSNAGALKLYNENMEEMTPEQVLLSVDSKNKKSNMVKAELTAELLSELGLQATATAEEVRNSLRELKARVEVAEMQLLAHRDKRAEELVDGAIRLGRIGTEKREPFVKLAKSDYDMAKDTLEAIPAKQSLSSKVNQQSNGSRVSELASLSWDELDRSGGLVALKMRDEALFREKYEAKFGKAYSGNE